MVVNHAQVDHGSADYDSYVNTQGQEPELVYMWPRVKFRFIHVVKFKSYDFVGYLIGVCILNLRISKVTAR